MPPNMNRRTVRSGALLGIVLLILALGIHLIFVGLTGAPVFRIINNSPSTLTEVSLAGTEWEKKIDRVAPASTLEFVQHVSGEQDFGMSFVANGKKHSGEGTYFEGSGGYCIDITIGVDYSVLVTVRTACFNIRRAS